jgi:hypothetical protein
MTDHDHGYQRLFSHPEMIRDLLVGFVREPWIADLDFATLEKYPAQPGRPARRISANAAARRRLPRTERPGGDPHHVS